MDVQAADILREQILNGKLPPGARLVESKLAEQLFVSRGTVRSALSDLSHQGLVEQVAYTKWQVPVLSPQDAWELCTLRCALEGMAAQLVATSPDGTKSEKLTTAYNLLADAIDQGRGQDEIAMADFGLHNTILELSGHSRLINQYKLIRQQVRLYINVSTAHLSDPKDIIDEHKGIVRAIVDGDVERAEFLAKNHKINEAQEHYKQIVRTHNDAKELS